MVSLAVAVTLVDAVGGVPEAGGSCRLVVRENGREVHSQAIEYKGGALTMTASVPPTWTHASVAIKPDHYALQGVTVNRGASDVYRNNPLAAILEAGETRLRLQMPLLRTREAPGLAPPSEPRPGDDLRAIWLRDKTNKADLVYSDLLLPGFLERRNVRSVLNALVGRSADAAMAAPLGDPDDPDWGRFQATRDRQAQSEHAGAPLILEYGEIGAVPASGPTFLVGVWAPNPPDSRAVPLWRDAVVFFHPSTATTAYPISAYPFTKNYPYVVNENPKVAEGQPGRRHQPYVSLTTKFFVADWSYYHLAGQDRVYIVPVLPHPAPNSPDEAEYGLPFRTQAGLARLLVEVNLFLHQRRYGWRGGNLDEWWGRRAPTGIRTSPADDVHFSAATVPAPPLRRVAAACYSASSPLLDALLSTPELPAGGRYPRGRWAAPQPLKQLIEAWCLDPLLGRTTILPEQFERHLLAWWTADDSRRFIITNSGTTGGGDPGRLYPQLRAAARTALPKVGTGKGRRAEVWRGRDERWLGMFCSNSYLSADTPNTEAWPPFPANVSDDEAHAFMYLLTAGLAMGWSTVGA